MLSHLRSDISKIDGKILSLLRERLSLTHEVGIWKRENHQTIVDPNREAEILADLRDDFSHDPDGIEQLWCEIMYMSKRDQYSLLRGNDTSLKIGIQGGRGSFNEIAVQQFLSNPNSLELMEID
jgi:chorismate mutase